MSGYLQEADGWLDVMFKDHAAGKISYAQMKGEIKGELLQSYKNGLEAAGKSPAPHGEKPRRFAARPQ